MFYVTNPTKTIVVIHLCFSLFNASKEPHLLCSLFMNLIDVLNWLVFVLFCSNFCFKVTTGSTLKTFNTEENPVNCEQETASWKSTVFRRV